MRYVVKEVIFKEGNPRDIDGKIIYVEKIMGMNSTDYWALCMVELKGEQK